MFWKPSPAMQRMLEAREKIVKRSPFFASVIFNARLIESKKHQTMWCEGNGIYFNPDFVLHPKAGPFIEGELLHNVLHSALLHWGRKQYRDDERWNQACDYSINPVIGDYFPKAPWMDVDARYFDKSPEEIYKLLEQNPPPPKPKPQNGKGGGGGKGKQQDEDQDQDGDGDSERDPNDPTNGEKPGGMYAPPTQEEEEQAERDWQRSLAGAVDKAKKAGVMPGNILRLVNQLMPSEKVDWKEILRDMSRDAKAKTTRTWARPNRRRLGGGEYMPGYGNDAIYRLVICFDVSGSVDHNMHKAMREEVASLIQQNIINRCTLIAVDTQIHNETDVSSVEELEAWNPRGGGGTDFRSAMDHIGKMQDVVGMLFLTDMETSSFGKEPPFSCVWVDWTGSNTKAPFGRTVPYTKD